MLSPLNSIGWLPLPSSTILSFFDLVTTCILRYPSLLVYFWILFVKSVLFSSPAWISSPWGFKLTLLPSEDKQVKYHHLKLLWVPDFHCFPFFLATQPTIGHSLSCFCVTEVAFGFQKICHSCSTNSAHQHTNSCWFVFVQWIDLQITLLGHHRYLKQISVICSLCWHSGKS